MIISIQDKNHPCTYPSILMISNSIPCQDYFHIKHDFIPVPAIYPFSANLFPHLQILNIYIIFHHYFMHPYSPNHYRDLK